MREIIRCIAAVVSAFYSFLIVLLFIVIHFYSFVIYLFQSYSVKKKKKRRKSLTLFRKDEKDYSHALSWSLLGWFVLPWRCEGAWKYSSWTPVWVPCKLAVTKVVLICLRYVSSCCPYYNYPGTELKLPIFYIFRLYNFILHVQWYYEIQGSRG